MSREIKFRAWLKKEKKTVDVSLIDLYYKGILFPSEPDVYSENGYDGEGREFKDIELMQFTGLKDVDGVEIYEGDILKKGNDVDVVEWTNDYAGFHLKKGYPIFNVDIINKYKIIGSKFENPELVGD